jgi:sarcosine oxidase subunit gamma
MAERLSALTNLASTAPSGARVHLSEVRPGSILQVQAWPDTIETVRAVMTSELLAEVPPVGSATVQNGTTVCAIAPGRFLMAGPADLFRQMETSLPAGDAAITDLSHARVILRLDGDGAEQVLQSCVMLDLVPRAFPPGRLAQTMIHHIDVLIHRRAETHFELWVLRGFAVALAEWVLDAGVE